MSDRSKAKRNAARATAPVAAPEAPIPPPAAGLVVVRVACADLHLDPANARDHDERNIAAIASSLARFAQQTPITIDAANVVRKGNGTLLAARKLGWEALDCVRTALTGVEAVGYSIADNRTSDLSQFIDVTLAETVKGLQSEPGFDIAAVGYTPDEVGALLEGMAAGLAGGAGGGSGGAREPAPGYSQQYGVIIMFADEAAQRKGYEDLMALGYECKVVVT